METKRKKYPVLYHWLNVLTKRTMELKLDVKDGRGIYIDKQKRVKSVSRVKIEIEKEKKEGEGEK